MVFSIFFSIKVSEFPKRYAIFCPFFRVNSLKLSCHPLVNNGSEGEEKPLSFTGSNRALEQYSFKLPLFVSFFHDLLGVILVHLLLQPFSPPVSGRSETATAELIMIPFHGFLEPICFLGHTSHLLTWYNSIHLCGISSNSFLFIPGVY